MNRRHDDEELAAELRQELIDAGAEPRDLTPSPGQAQRAEAVLAAIIMRPRRPETLPATRARQSPARARRWARAGAFMAAAAALALVLVTVRPGQGPEHAAALTPPLLRFDDVAAGALPAAGRPARAELESLAGKAESLPDTSGGVQHVVLDSWLASTGDSEGEPVHSALVPVRSEMFFQPDGTMRSIERRGRPLDQQGRIDTSPDSDPGPVQSDDSFESSDPGPDYAQGLPTEPSELLSALRARQDPLVCADRSGGCLMDDIIDLYHSYVVPPVLTAALWRVLATDSSVTYLGATSDRLGRDAMAFTTLGVDGTSQGLLFADARTGAYLGDEMVLTKRSDAFSFTPPAVISFSALVRAERISEDQLPASR